MSARSVCSGTRPSRSHPRRAIAAPPSRPEQLMRMPSAPRRMADCTARFMARRNATRRSSCWAIDSATSLASSSGLRISMMLRTTSLSVSFATALRSFSMSAPFLPMTTPGRAEWIVTRHFLCGRSITILDTAACLSCLVNASRISMSSCKSLPYSFLPAYHRESQVRLMPRRRPVGLTFWPIGGSLGARLDLTNHDRQVREQLENLAGAAAAAGVKALDDEAFADMGARHHEIVDVEIVIVLGIRNGRLEALAHVLGDALVRELQVGECCLHLLAADELGKQVEFLRADAQHAGDGFGLVVRKAARMSGLPHLILTL